MHEFSSEKVQTQNTRVQSGMLPARANDPFDLAYHPNSWQWDDDAACFMPRFRRLYHTPGCNGVKDLGGGRRDPSAMRAWAQSEGYIIISGAEPVEYHDRHGQLVSDVGYLKRYRVGGGHCYCTVWDNPTVTGAGRTAKVRWGIGLDRAGYDSWRLALARKYGWEPDAALVADMVANAEKRGTRRIAEAHDGNPHVQALVAAQLERAARMRAAAETDDEVLFDGEAEPVEVA